MEVHVEDEDEQSDDKEKEEDQANGIGSDNPSPLYYDAHSPSFLRQQEPQSFFSGSAKLHVVDEDHGDYEKAEHNRYKKIQALDGTGWQVPYGPFDQDDDSL
jgi:hypothetical protein